MKTTLDIPENELKDALLYTGAKTKRDAIVFAVTDFNRRQRLRQIAQSLGTFDGFLSPEELQAHRNAEIER